jgi:hypothetical protein
MSLIEESWDVRHGIATFLQQLAFVDRRWVRIDSCANNTFLPQGSTEEVDCPLECFSDLLGVSRRKANDFLCAAKLLVPHRRFKQSLGPNKGVWDSLISEYQLDIELEPSTNAKYLGKRFFAIRIGLSTGTNSLFNAQLQGERFFVEHWKPKRLRATSEANAFIYATSFALTMYKAKLEKLAQLEEDGYDGSSDEDDDGSSDEDDDQFTTRGKHKSDPQTSPFTTPGKPKSDPQTTPPTEVKFNMNEATHAPIKWKSPNGTTQTAVRIPRSSKRSSFRKSVKVTGWLDHVMNNMYNESRVPPDVANGWLIESIVERCRPEFEAYCEQKGHMLPTTARMSPDKTAAMWTDGNVSYAVQRTLGQHCYDHFRRRMFAKETDVKGFGDTALMPNIGVYTDENKKHIFYWWKPPDDLLNHEINNLLNEDNVSKLVSVDFSTGGDHGKGRFRQIITLVLRFEDKSDTITRRYVIGEIDSGKDSTKILKETFLIDLNDRLKRLASGVFNVTRDGDDGKYGVEFSRTCFPLAEKTTVLKSVPSRIFLCGDAKFYMQVLGRENAAPHWCVWCNINVRQFDFTTYPEVEHWTLASMKAHRDRNLDGPARLGVYEEPLFSFCEPDNILPNALHEKINTGNDLVACLYRFTDSHIEMVTQEESDMRADAKVAELSLGNCRDEIKDYQFACRSLSISIADLIGDRNRASLSMEEQRRLGEDEEELETMEEELNHFRETILPYARKEHAEKKKAFETIWKARGVEDNQVHNHIDHEIFNKFKMRTQAYHGGDKYTGVDIGVLMDKSDEIMERVEIYLQEFQHPLKEASNLHISEFCGRMKRVLRLLDIMFSTLRKNNGEVTDDDLKEYEDASNKAVVLWSELGLSYTPSFHYVHKEAHRLLVIHRGFGEFLEDHLEQSHQTMEKIHKRLGNLGFGAKRAMAISRLAQMANDPVLLKNIATIKASRRRKFVTASKGVMKKASVKKIKTEKRSKNLDEEMSRNM